MSNVNEVRQRVLETAKEYTGKLVRILPEAELFFVDYLLVEIGNLYRDGYTPEVIGESLNRDPDEIFLALFHLSKQDESIEPFARRIR